MKIAYQKIDMNWYEQLKFFFYKDVYSYFNKVSVTTLDEFKKKNKHCQLTHLGQEIYHIQSRKFVSIWRNWIWTGVNKISDLKFMDGKLDENYISENWILRKHS